MLHPHLQAAHGALVHGTAGGTTRANAAAIHINHHTGNRRVRVRSFTELHAQADAIGAVSQLLNAGRCARHSLRVELDTPSTRSVLRVFHGEGRRAATTGAAVVWPAHTDRVARCLQPAELAARVIDSGDSEPFDIGKASVDEMVAFAATEYQVVLDPKKHHNALRAELRALAKQHGSLAD